MLGGARPLVLMQCTGMFEAGDALRNVVHDLELPLVMGIGVRSLLASYAGTTRDTCPRFTEPILQAWLVPYALLQAGFIAQDLEGALAGAYAAEKASAVLFPE
jgi:sulfopyruvate decarboxylase TPP-binding subunit